MAENEKPMEVKDILSLIADTNKKLEQDVYIPSLGKEIHIKSLNATHTKNIAKSALEGVFSPNHFTLMMYNVLNEIKDPSISLAYLNILDKVVLLLELRSKNISSELVVHVRSEKGDTTTTVEIPALLNKIKKMKLSFTDVEVGNEQYKVVLNYPSIEEEYQFENNLYKTRIQGLDQKNVDSIKSLFAPMFINAVAQYVKQVKIGDQIIDLVDKKIADRLAITEALPASVFNQITTKIDTVFGKQLTKINQIKVTINDIEYTGEVELSPVLFLN
jgi:hypothetical protein